MNKISISTIGDLKKIFKNYPDTTHLCFSMKQNTCEGLFISETHGIGDRDTEDIPVLSFTGKDVLLNEVHFSKPLTYKFYLKGEILTSKVYLNGELLDIKESLKFKKHSPTGFSWGYDGSGPAQLALAICLKLTETEYIDDMHYQTFKKQYIASLPHQEDFDIIIEI